MLLMPPSNCAILNVPQRSKEWLSARLGRLTGSRVADALAVTKKGEWTADRKNLRMALALERITGESQERPRSGYQIRDGIAREPLAAHAYEVTTGTILNHCGFVMDKTFLIGCSPDGYVGDFEGIISIKCPLATTHLETIVGLRAWREKQGGDIEVLAKSHPLYLGIIGDEYLNQIRHELLITDAHWCDYVSYHPYFPPKLRLVIVRVTRDDLDLPAYAVAVRAFLTEVEVEVQKVMAMAA